VGLDTIGVSGNKMAGSSEVTELVMLVSAENALLMTTTYKLDPIGQFIAWT
jgi:hypothetical protein